LTQEKSTTGNTMPFSMIFS